MYQKVFSWVFLGIFFAFSTNLLAEEPVIEEGFEEVHENGEEFDPTEMIFHHISNANEFHIVTIGENEITLPLPVILFDTESNSIQFFLSSKFHHGHIAHNGYALDHGVVKKIQGDFPKGEVEVHWGHEEDTAGNEVPVILYNGNTYQVGSAGFLDFSITKNVFGMMVAALLMFIIFLSVARAYKKREGQPPKGLQSFIEPLIVFVRDDIAKPTIGAKYERFLPFLATVFFFIWINNMLGLVPIFPGSANVTGNLMVTGTLALFTMLITNLNGNKHYWQHTFWMPGMPIPVRFMLAIIEGAQIIIKPVALTIRLFANMTAGHIIILSLASLIFIFGELGQNLGGGIAGISLAVPFMIFMNVLELLVAALQAFIFTILSALFIGQAVEEHH